MSSKVLVTFATMYGSTTEVAEAVASTLRESGADVDLVPAGDVRALTEYTAVVVGAPLITHHLHKDARRFLSRNQKILGELPVALFALGPVHDEEKEWEDCQGQLDHELEDLSWLHPVAAELFGGRFDPALLRFPFNKMASAEPASDARDWEAIRAWARGLPGLFEGAGS